MTSHLKKDFEPRPNTAPLPRNLVLNLQKGGYDLFDVACDIGLDPKYIISGLTFAEADALLTRAWEIFDDPAICLKVGMTVDPRLYNSSGLYAIVAPTLDVAYERHARYSPLVSGFPMSVAVVDDHAELKIDSRPLESRPYCFAKVDFHFTSMLGFMRLSTGRDIQPRYIKLRRPKPDFAALYAEKFGCPIRFSEGENVMAISLDDYLADQVTCNPAMEDFLAQAINQLMLDLQDDTISGRIRRLLDAGENLRKATLAATAMLMAVSPRTLQRHLTQEGTSFAALLDGVRHESALRALAIKGANVNSLSFDLGFMNVNSFYRAFKRWTGMTIAEFHQSRRSERQLPFRPSSD